MILYQKTCDGKPHRNPKTGGRCDDSCYEPLEFEPITVLAPARLVVNPITERKAKR